MLDRLHLYIPFKQEACLSYFWTQQKRRSKVTDILVSSVDLKSLGVPMQGGVTVDQYNVAHVENLRHAWEKLPSSYTPMAFKVFHEGFGFRGQAGIELKASPAKVLQGHNLYGSTSIYEGAIAMLDWLALAYPDLADKLDIAAAEVQALDCTYSARLPNERTAQQVIDAINNISNGQTKSRGDSYTSTAYWGSKNSRLKHLKAYLKQYEYAHQLVEAQRAANGYGEMADAAKRTHAVMSDPRLIEWSKCLLRFEATAKSRWLFRRRIPTNLKALIDYQEQLEKQGRCLIREIWQEMTAPIFKACEGMEMTMIDDDKVREALRDTHVKYNKHGKAVYTFAHNVFNTYRNICNYGWDETRQSIAPSTWNKHIRALDACGLSKASLQKLREIRKNEVVPLLRFIEVDFSSQRPPWYEEPKSEQVIEDFEKWKASKAANDEPAPPEQAATVTPLPSHPATEISFVKLPWGGSDARALRMLTKRKKTPDKSGKRAVAC